MKVEEGCTPALKEAASSKSSNSPAGRMRLARLSIPEHGAPTTSSYLGHEEARICEYGVSKARNGLTTGINEKDITRWGRDPDQVFLGFSRNLFDIGTITWMLYSPCRPLEKSMGQESQTGWPREPQVAIKRVFPDES